MRTLKIIKYGLCFVVGISIGIITTHQYEKKRHQKEMDIIINDYERTIKHMNNDFTSLALSKGVNNSEECLRDPQPDIDLNQDSTCQKPDLKDYPVYEEGEYTMYNSIRGKYIIEDEEEYEDVNVKKSKKKKEYGSPEYNNYVATSSRGPTDKFWPLSDVEFADSHSEVSTLFYHIVTEEITDTDEEIIGIEALSDMIGTDALDFLMDEGERLLDYGVNQIYIYDNHNDIIYMIIIKHGSPQSFDTLE